ncbi:hypothetical protein JCM14469_08020 [Desulfatiferula olefinivorans]
MKKKNRSLVLLTVTATGIASVGGQLVMLREYLALFSGNECLIALTLFNWLIGGGLGSLSFLFVDRYRPGSASSQKTLGFLSFLLCALGPLTLLALRVLRDLLFLHGSSPGLSAIVFFSFLTILPYAGLVGFALPFSLRAAREDRPDFPGALIYITDNLGDMLGGALFSFVLVYLLTPVEAMVVSALPLAAAALALTWKSRAGLPALILTLGLFVSALALELWSLTPAQGTLARYLETRYGRILVVEDQGRHTLFQDGEPLFSSDDRVGAEERVHYALSQVDRIESVLLVSSRSGILTEIEKYRPSSVDYVEIDPMLTQSLMDFGLMSDIEGLNPIHTDARAFLSETSNTYDAILLNLPEPSTFQVNRFYTREAFRLMAGRLEPDGVLAFSVAGFDSYLNRENKDLLSCLHRTAREVFDHVLILPGRETCLICANRPLDPDIPALLGQKGISTRYIGDYYSADVSPARRAYLMSMLTPEATVNTDARPVLMSLAITQWFARHHTRPLVFIGGLVLAAAFYLPRLSREEYVLFTTGFTIMGSEILSLFSVQIVFGYLYVRMGVLITVFLAGLLPGALLAAKNRFARRRRLFLARADLTLAGLVLFFIAGSLTPMIKTHMVFYLVFGFAVSLTCGFQFPLVLAGDESNSLAGRAFSADLTGAAFGVLLTSVILVPAFGIPGAALALCLLKLTSLWVIRGRSL